MVFFMATISGDVQYTQNGTFTNPSWWLWMSPGGTISSEWLPPLCSARHRLTLSSTSLQQQWQQQQQPQRGKNNIYDHDNIASDNDNDNDAHNSDNDS